MRINRRELMATGLGVSATGMRTFKPGKRTFRHAFCNESMRGMPWPDQCKLVSSAGYAGIEIAPFSLVKSGVGELTAADRRLMVSAMKDNGLQCAGLHWLLVAPPAGLHCTTPDAEVRRRTWAYIDDLIDFCGDMGGTVMIFGSPKQRNAQGIAVSQAVANLTEGLAGVADHARARQVMILLESLDHTQTDVINTLEEASQVVRAVNHPAIQTMFDFHNTLDEKEPFDVLIRKYSGMIRHVHVQEMDGKYLGAGSGVQTYRKAFEVLDELGYDLWVSVEVFDFAPGARFMAEESMKSLRSLE